MAYIAQDESAVNDLTDAAFLNQLADNLDWLATPPIQEYVHPDAGGDYTISPTLYMVPIDTTNMKFTFTSYGRPLLCVLSFVCDTTVNDGSLAFGYQLDDDGRLGIGRFGGYARQAGVWTRITGDHVHWTIVMPVPLISPGVHTIEPTWGLNGTGTITVIDDYTVFWGIWEV